MSQDIRMAFTDLISKQDSLCNVTKAEIEIGQALQEAVAKSSNSQLPPGESVQAKLHTPVISVDKKSKRDFDQILGTPPSPVINPDVLKQIDGLIAQKMTSWNLKLEEAKNEVNINTNKRIEELQNSLAGSKEGIMKGIKEILSSYDNTIKKQSDKIASLEYKLQAEVEKRISHEAYSRRLNIKILKLPNKVQNIEEHILNIFQSAEIKIASSDIDSVHRLRSQSHKGNILPVIVRFNTFKAKMLVWNGRKQIQDLEECDFTIVNDIPQEWINRRRILWPFVEAARKIKKPDGTNISAYIKNDKMVIDGKTYSVDTVNELPDCLNPRVIYTPMDDKVVLFYSKMSPFSNHYKCVFTVDNTNYNCSEQFIMQRKALFFGDTNLAERIMQEESAVRQKELGKNVKGFSQKLWCANARKIVYHGIEAKFAQNPDIMDLLLSTGQRKIAEANMHDNLFAISLGLNDPNVWDMSNWTGKNLMGKILMSIRNQQLGTSLSDEEELESNE